MYRMLSTLHSVLFGLAVILLIAACNRQDATPPGAPQTDQAEAISTGAPPAELLATQQAFIAVATQITPAVVNIRAERRRDESPLGPLFDEFFGDLFRQPRREQREQSLGSGFLISSDGAILTNEHVIAGAEQISVRLPDQRTFRAELVGSDPKTDVAVIRIVTDEPLPFLRLGDSTQLRVGQWALAIGNPFGLDSTLTVGVISATGRTDIGIGAYENFIQTDASINPGNSGGPLLNIHGEVIGINTAIVARGQGIGFAIPIDLAWQVAEQLLDKGEVTRGWLGVAIQPLDADLARSFGLDRATGALVTQVLPETPAASAGLRRGDVLLAFNGEPIRTVRELQLLVASAPVGKPVPVDLQRDGRRLSLQVTLIARDEQAGSQPAAPPAPSFWLGMELTDSTEGIRVSTVRDGSLAAQAGIRAGDIILAVNRHDVATLQQLQSLRGRLPRDGQLLLLLGRGPENRYLVLPGEAG
ncbi:MAG: Do family serine endopeptidase [Desulfuromonadales bacterium]|nr:Do family serine endopeptidase [Desulfuromonadales bacterium]